MPFPSGASTIVVKGTFPSPVGGGNRGGKVVFKPSARLVDATNHAIYSGDGDAEIIDGQFEIRLLCTDDTDVQPAGWRWKVDEQPAGGERAIYYIELTADLGPEVDLDTLAAVSEPDGSGGPSLPPTGPAGGALAGAYPNPTLSAATIASFDPAGAAAAAQNAAALDATAKVTAHSVDTTDVHGIADTSQLETQAGAQAKANASEASATATAAAALASHEADSTNVHGISNTANLETQTGAQTKATAAQSAATATAAAALASHEADTTNIHGIADTAALETQTGAQTKATAAQAAATSAAATDATSKVAAHSAATTSVHGITNTAALETQTGAQGKADAAQAAAATDATSKVSTHAGATDPHGDRAYADSTKLAKSSNLSDLGSASTARTNLGLGNAATRPVGTTSGTVAAGDDSRLSDARTPTAHAASHASAGSDPLTLTQSQVTGLTPALWADRPGDQNLLAWTYNPDMAGHVTAQSNSGVAGRITLVRIILREAITWSNIWIGLAGVDAGASLANCYLGVYDSSGTLKGATADISTSLMSGATAKALPLAVPFSAAAGTYFIAMLLNGTWTTNSLTFKASGAGISVNAGLSAPNLRYSNMLTAQTSLPSSLTLSSQSTSIINTGWASQWYGVS